MPRQSRLDIPGLLQHVIVRGIERTDIFLDDEDRSRFIARFGKLLVETGTDCFAWALIPNHYHLLLRCNRLELSRFTRRLLTGYAVTFNRRHARSGHLFQNRYKCSQPGSRAWGEISESADKDIGLVAVSLSPFRSLKKPARDFAPGRFFFTGSRLRQISFSR